MKNYYLAIFITVFFFSCSSNEEKLVERVFTFQSNSAKEVYISGDFNGWSKDKAPLKKTADGAWRITLELAPNYYQYQFIVDGKKIADPNVDWKLPDNDEFKSVIKIGEPPIPKRKINSREFPKEKLPQPVIQTRPDLVELYYAAWSAAWNKIQEGNEENGFPKYYMDEGYNELIFQWDVCFVANYAMYARDVFPAMASLNIFYEKQRKDGHIQRVYKESNGELVHEPTPEEPMVNPPLFAWTEWRYFEFTGDSSRIKKYLPNLTRYYEWVKENTMSALPGKQLFYTTPFGSGMDNLPRPEVGMGGWIDQSAQQALNALYVSKIAGALGDKKLSKKYFEEYSKIKEDINKFLWNDDKKFYYDITENEEFSPVTHVGAFWTLLPKIPDKKKLDGTISHLKNPLEFWRPHLVPALAADQEAYDKRGNYWKGGVWAPTNYMVVRGLTANEKYSLADSAAQNHLDNLSEVYFKFKPEVEKLNFRQRYDDGYRSLWECYSPELSEPATDGDNNFYSKQDYVGWTGLGPISMLIENFLGLEISGFENKIVWRINRDDKHGLKNFLLGEKKVDAVFEIIDGTPTVKINCKNKFILEVFYRGKNFQYETEVGKNEFKLL